MTTNDALRRTVRLVVLLNIAYFGIEFAVAVAIGSVSLFADSIDFLEDSSINFLIIVALGWTARNRARVGNGARGHSARAWAGDPLDGLAEVEHSGASGTGCPNTHRAGGARPTSPQSPTQWHLESRRREGALLTTSAKQLSV